MKHKFLQHYPLMIAVVAVIGIIIAVSPAFTQMSAREIMEKVEDSNNYWARKAVLSMTIYWDLTDPNTETRIRKMLGFALEDESNDETYMLSYFRCPADVEGTAFLNYDKPGQEDVQYLFQPAFEDVRDAPRRIHSSEKGNSFMGSDFTYEDMQATDIDDYNYELLGEETIVRDQCYKIEATPTEDNDDTSYSKRIIWVSQDKWLPLRIQFFDENEDLLKTLEFKRISQISGIYTPQLMVMFNTQTKSGTKLETTDIQYYTQGNAPFGKDMFTPEQMNRVPSQFAQSFNGLSCP